MGTGRIHAESRGSVFLSVPELLKETENPSEVPDPCPQASEVLQEVTSPSEVLVSFLQASEVLSQVLVSFPQALEVLDTFFQTPEVQALVSQESEVREPFSNTTDVHQESKGSVEVLEPVLQAEQLVIVLEDSPPAHHDEVQEGKPRPWDSDSRRAQSFSYRPGM